MCQSRKLCQGDMRDNFACQGWPNFGYFIVWIFQEELGGGGSAPPDTSLDSCVCLLKIHLNGTALFPIVWRYFYSVLGSIVFIDNLTLSVIGYNRTTAATGLGTMPKRSGSNPYTSTNCHSFGTPKLWMYWS